MRSAGISICLAAGLAIGAAAPAGAIDSMVGSYAGKLSCKGYAGGAATKSKQDATVVIGETKGGALMRISAGGAPLGETIFVFALADATKTDRAKLQGLDCPSTVGSGHNLAMEGDIVIKPGSEKGTLKGSLIRREAGGMPAVIDVCTFTVKRTSTELPEVPVCPPVEI
jgi:hypothetical protein